jgi:hypothetical protein
MSEPGGVGRGLQTLRVTRVSADSSRRLEGALDTSLRRWPRAGQSGLIWSTAGDLTRFTAALHAGELLAASSLRAVCTAHAATHL